MQRSIIVRREPKRDHDAYVLAMWIRFLLAPNETKPDIDGAFDLGEVGSAHEKNWTKATPYSVARAEK